MPKWLGIVLGVILLLVGIALTALLISAEIGVPMAIVGIGMIAAVV
jgi:hypothetical protein